MISEPFNTHQVNKKHVQNSCYKLSIYKAAFVRTILKWILKRGMWIGRLNWNLVGHGAVAEFLNHSHKLPSTIQDGNFLTNWDTSNCSAPLVPLFSSVCTAKMYTHSCKHSCSTRYFSIVCHKISLTGKSQSVATRYGLGDPEIEFWWRGQHFPQQSRPKPTQPSVQWVAGLFPEDTAAGAWRWLSTPHPPNLAPTLKKEYSYTSTHFLGLHGLL